MEERRRRRGAPAAHLAVTALGVAAVPAYGVLRGGGPGEGSGSGEGVSGPAVAY